MKPGAMSSAPKVLPKMMLGFVVRRCAAAVGHAPSAEEFARWANTQHDGDRRFSLFGRPISVHEAQLILRHPGRPVSARGAAAHECVDDGAVARTNVTSFAAAAARLKSRTR